MSGACDTPQRLREEERSSQVAHNIIDFFESVVYERNIKLHKSNLGILMEVKLKRVKKPT